MKIGKLIRMKREKKDLTREQLARKLKISEGYLGHLERDSHVHLSETLKTRAEKVLGIRIPRKALEAANKRSREWYRAYRKKTA